MALSKAETAFVLKLKAQGATKEMAMEKLEQYRATLPKQKPNRPDPKGFKPDQVRTSANNSGMLNTLNKSMESLKQGGIQSALKTLAGAGASSMIKGLAAQNAARPKSSPEQDFEAAIDQDLNKRNIDAKGMSFGAKKNLYEKLRGGAPVDFRDGEIVGGDVGITQDVANIGKGIYDATIQPVAEGALTASVGPLIAGVKELIPGGGDLRTPIEVPGVGQINPNAKSPQELVGDAARFGAGAANIASMGSSSLATNVGVQAAAGGGLAFGDAIKEGKNPWDIAWDTASGAAVQGGLAFFIGKLTGKVSTSKKEVVNQLEDKLLKKGVKEQYSNILGKLKPDEKKIAMDYFDAGLNKLQDFQADDIYRYASKESGLDDFVKGLDDLKSSFGKEVGAAKTGLSKITVADDALRGSTSKMDDIFKKYNIKSTKKGLDFTNSELAGATKAQEQIDKVFKTLHKGKGVNARDIEAITGQIDQATGVLKTSGLKKGDPAVQALTDIKRIINDIVGQSDRTFGGANKKYAEFIKDYNQIKNTGKVSLGGGKDTFSGPQILKRSIQTIDTKPKAAIEAMQRLSDKFGLKMPKNLKLRARLADITENFTSTKQPRSLGGEVTGAAENIPGKTGLAVKGVRKLKETLTRKSTRPLQEQVEEVTKIIEKSLAKAEKSGRDTITLPKNVGAMLMALTKGNTPGQAN